jgi:hypothetical protein
MHGLWMLIHMLGFTLWLGGGMATMVAGVTAKRFTPAERLKAYKLIGAVQRLLVGPGALGVVLSGIMLSMAFMRSGMMPGWLNGMTGAGLLGALVAVTISVPTAARLARLEVDAKGELPAAFQGLRKRQVIAATVAGSLGLVALFAGTLAR